MVAFSSYDQWKTMTPEEYYGTDGYEDIEAGECTQCGETFYHGEEVYFDSRLGHHFCDKTCFKKWLHVNQNDELDYYIELLEDKKDTYETTIEADFDEREDDDY